MSCFPYIFFYLDFVVAVDASRRWALCARICEKRRKALNDLLLVHCIYDDVHHVCTVQ